MEREILTAALAPGAGCLSMEQLGRYADGALGTDEQAAAATHVRGCLNCQAELALRQAVTSSNARPGEADVVRDGVARLEQRGSEIFGAGGQAPSAGRWIRLGIPSLAAAVLVSAGALYLRTGPPPELPGQVTSEGEVTRSLSVPVRGPVGDLAEAPTRLEWRGVDRAVRYRVRLMEVDRREVWSLSTSAVGAELPPAIRALLVPGRSLVWDVIAYDAGDAVIAESGPQTFRLVVP